MYHDIMGYPDWYKKASASFRSARAASAIRMLDRLATISVAALYVTALASLAVNGDPRIWATLAVPAATFVFVTVLRRLIDEPRPYERYGISPIIRKDTHGKSMPSRHIASASIIAAALLRLHPVLGTAALAGCALLAFTRIVGGVHFPRDVIVAAILSFSCGAIGFALA